MSKARAREKPLFRDRSGNRISGICLWHDENSYSMEEVEGHDLPLATPEVVSPAAHPKPPVGSSGRSARLSRRTHPDLIERSSRIFGVCDWQHPLLVLLAGWNFESQRKNAMQSNRLPSLPPEFQSQSLKTLLVYGNTSTLQVGRRVRISIAAHHF